MDYGNLPKINNRDAFTVGESTLARRDISSASVTSGGSSLRLCYFTAAKTETISSVRCITGGTPAAATPTLCRIGIYSENPSTGDLTLVGSTPNDTALFSAANTVYTKALSVPFVKYKGVRYAVGLIVVSAFATPNFQGNQSTPANEAAISPRLSGYSAQTDLPASITAASLTDGSNSIFFALT